MDVLTTIVVIVAVLSAGAVNAEVQRRLMAQGGRWFAGTIKLGLCGFGAMIGIVAIYFLIGSIAFRSVG